MAIAGKPEDAALQEGQLSRALTQGIVQNPVAQIAHPAPFIGTIQAPRKMHAIEFNPPKTTFRLRTLRGSGHVLDWLGRGMDEIHDAFIMTQLWHHRPLRLLRNYL